MLIIDENPPSDIPGVTPALEVAATAVDAEDVLAAADDSAEPDSLEVESRSAARLKDEPAVADAGARGGSVSSGRREGSRRKAPAVA